MFAYSLARFDFLFWISQLAIHSSIHQRLPPLAWLLRCGDDDDDFACRLLPLLSRGGGAPLCMLCALPQCVEISYIFSLA